MLFGDVLRELLEDRGISQKEMAEFMNLAPSTFGNYVRNQREPDYATLKKIADYFEVSVDYLLDYRPKTGMPHTEERMLRTFQRLTPKNRNLLLQIAALMEREQNPEGK